MYNFIKMRNHGSELLLHVTQEQGRGVDGEPSQTSDDVVANAHDVDVVLFSNRQPYNDCVQE